MGQERKATALSTLQSQEENKSQKYHQQLYDCRNQQQFSYNSYSAENQICSSKDQTQQQIFSQNPKQSKIDRSYFYDTLIKIAILTHLLPLVKSNGIYMTLSSSNQYVGSTSNYSIAFNRSLNTLGQSISQSALESSYQIAIIFDSSYNISSSISISPSNYSLNVNSQTATLFLSQSINSISISSITNPYPSQTPLKITLNFYNSSSPSVVVDTCYSTLSFQALALASSAISYQFTPGNVSTQSNLSLKFVPFTWSSSKMALQLNFLTYWSRNMLNVSSNQVLNSMSYCLPTCTISNMGNFFLVQFNSLSLSNSSISITIYNILSPATLQLADTISITVTQTTYNTDFQTGTLYISSASPNNLQILTSSTTSTIGNFVTLTIALTTQDLFSSNDSIIIVMNTPVAMASQVTINNILVASNSFSVQQNSIITISNFILVTNIPGQFSGSITITNISSQSSVKPVNGNKISFYRNGYLYDQSQFAFNVNQANINSINLSLASNKANANTNLTMSIGLTDGVINSDILYVNIDQAITVNTCNVLSCTNCTCLITMANPSQGIFSNNLKITNFGSSSTVTTSIIILLSIKNPISSNYILYFTTTDQSNYTKQVGSQNFPNITQSVISSSIFSLNNTSNVVYQATNFTIGLNFTGYTLLNGWLTILIDPVITLLDSSNKFCLVNSNNGACTLSLINSTILANISVSSQTQFYTIVINNLRNPTSTRFFSFQVSIADVNNLVYYTLVSPNYQVTNTYTITPQVTSSNCTNSASNTIAITFPYLPFLPSNALMVDDSSAKSVQGESILKKLDYPVVFASNISLQITDFYSLEPIYYQVLVVTNDLLYNIFNFNFSITNCNSSYLPILSYAFTGLPENTGTLTFVINQVQVQSGTSTLNGISYLTLTFPSEYASNMTISSNAQTTSQLGPRYFNLSIGNTQPITVSIWGFNNVLGSFLSLQAYSFSQAGSFLSYSVSSNTNTIKYNLSTITNCTLPCKICSSNNNSACIQCYSSATTQYYFYNPVLQSCVLPAACSSTTFPNYTLNSCISCPTQCSTCTSLSVCLSCTANYFLLNNTCLTSCPSGYYPINPQQICSLCDSVNNTAHCQTCISINICSTCLYPYYLNPSTKTCVVSCSSNEIPLNSTCFSCNSYCSTCQGSLSNCTSCVTGYYLLGNSCLASCPSPYVSSTITNICVNCSSICYLCTNTPTTCTSCQYPLKLFNSTCISDCPIGFYTNTANNNTLQCLGCLSQCSACSSQAICTTCISGYYFYNNNCLYTCPISTYNKSISNNNTISLVCLPCSSYCLTCLNSANCSQCQSSYYLSSNLNSTFCISACSSGEYLNGNTCQQCSSNCINCLNSSICLLCTTSYSLQSSMCVSNCSNGYVSILDNAVLPSLNSSAYICKSCSLIYQYCSNCIATACTLCTSGYIINYDQNCVVICSAGYINISNTCVTCSFECKTCSNTQANCTSCSTGYVFYQNITSQVNKCSVNCASGMFNLSGICTSCISPCLTCVNSSSLCLSCMTGFYSLINASLSCVASCPANSYIFNAQCIFCSSTCSICDANGCLSCFPQYYINAGTVIGSKTYYQCYSTCPSNLPFLINSTCSQCALNCQVCTTSSCLQCVNGTYGFQQYCLNQCPPDMIPSSGICIIPPNITNNSTNTTNSSMIPVASSNVIIIPVPFTICTTIIILTIMISKLAHPNTLISLAVFSIISFLAIICNLFYLVKSLTNQPASIYSIILIIGLLINYINNTIFLFVSKYTLLRDHEFSCWKRGNVQLIKQQKLDVNQPSHINLQDQLNSDYHSELNDDKVPKRFYTYECVWYLVLTIGFFSSQNLYTLVFSQLFDLSIFKAAVETVKNLKILNYVWVVALIAHLVCLISGIISAALAYPTDSQYLIQIYQSVDLVVLNSVCLIFGLLLLRKKRQVWERERARSIGEEANSTKKVIFDHESHEIDMNNEIQNQSQVNGKIKNLMGTQNAGSEQEIVGASYKSSTNQEESDLYFEKQEGENLDNSEDIKQQNNIIWMQINPDEMMPDLVEKNESQMFEISASPSQLEKAKAKSTLNPDNNLDTLDFNQIYPEQSDEQNSSSEKEKKSKQNQQVRQIDNPSKQNSAQDKQDDNQSIQLDNYEEGDQQIPANRQRKLISQKPNIDEGVDENKNQQEDRKSEVNKSLLSNSITQKELTQSNNRKENINKTVIPETYKPKSYIRVEKQVNHTQEQQQSNQQLEANYSEDNNLPEITQDAQNNQRDDQQFKRSQRPTNLVKSSSKISNISKNLRSSKTGFTNQLKNMPSRHQSPKKLEQTGQKIDNNQRYLSDDRSFHQQNDEDNDDDDLMKMQQFHQIPQNKATIPLQADQAVPINKSDIINMVQNESIDYCSSSQAENELSNDTPIQKREIKTDQGRRQRRQNESKETSRYIPKLEGMNEKELKDIAKISGFQQLFNEYQSQSSPRITPNELEQALNQQSISIHGDPNANPNESNFENRASSLEKSNTSQSKSKELSKFSPQKSDHSKQSKEQSPRINQKGRYTKLSKYDPIKQELNEQRMSNSAHNFTNNKPNITHNKYLEKQEFSPVLHQAGEQIEDNNGTIEYRTLPHKQQTTQSQLLKKSIYKSINIAKINNRLGSVDQPQGVRTLSRDSYLSPRTGLKSDKANSLPKNNLHSFKTDALNSSNVSQFEKKQAWKSRLMSSSSRENLNGTAKLIERKSKLADVKAKLESIYLPTK